MGSETEATAMQDSSYSYFIMPEALELRDANQSLNDFDFNDGSAFNESWEDECITRSYQNITYYNVSCDMPTEFSVPLYGEL